MAYERQHAVFFVAEYVPSGWSTGREWTWAIRRRGSSALLGAAGVQL